MRRISILVALVLLVLTSAAQAQTLRADRFVLNTGPCSFLSGPASPEGASNGVAGPCSWYYQTASPFTTYRKMSGTGNTGWVALSTGGGSVTSVGLALPAFLTVSGSPVTGSGTLTGTLATQTAAFVFAGPTSGGAATPTFRALGLTDLPAGTGTVTSVGLALPNIFTVSGSPVTTSGTLTGTLATQAANTFFAGPTSGGAATPGFRITVLADLPVVDVAHGGTGLSTIGANGVLYGNGASNVGVTSAGGANSVLAANGGAPAFSTTPTVTNLTATGLVAAANVTASTSVTTVALTATGTTILDANTGTSDFASQTTGWRVTEPGAADFRYLFVDEMHAKLFIADLEQALAGGQIVSKGVAVLSSDFTCPAASGTSTLSVEDLPGAPDMQVFQANDFVVLRSFARAAGSLTIGDCVGVVTSPSTAGAGFQTWTFTRQAGGGGGGALAFVNRAESTLPGGAQASAATASASHTAGNLLVVGVSVNSATGITVTDTAGNTYTQAGSTVNQGGIRVSLWYAYNITGHASNVVTAALTSGSATYFNASVRQFSGALTTNPIDGTAGATGNSTSLSSGSVAVTASESVIVAMMEADGQSLIAGSGYALTRFNGGTGDGGYFADEYKIVTASEAATATASTGGWGIAAAAFKVAPGGGGGCAGGMPTSTVVPAKGLALDYGVSGNGYYEVNAIDGAYGANSPYAQIVTWATCPISTNRTLRTRFGRLDGITSGSSEYGMIAGTYSGTNGQYFRASNQAFELHGIDLLLWQGATNTIKLDHAVPSFALGSPVPSAYGTGTGIWMGNDGGTYKFRVGNPAGNRVTWDGTTLTVAGDGAGVTNINGGNIQTNTVTLSQVNFVPILGTNVVASINASAEGIQISGARIGINGSTTFSAGYDPTGKIAAGGAAADVNAGSTVITGGKITVSSASTFASGYDPTGRIAAGGAAADVNANSTVITGGKITVNSSSTFGSGYDPSGKIATGGAAADVNGGSTVITGGLITVNGSSTFAAGYNPTGKVAAGGAAADINANVTTISGGKITTGTVTATQINVTELSSLGATIGGWTLGSDYIRDVANTCGIASTVTGGNDVRFWCGAAFGSRDSAPFHLEENGSLTATNVNITGTVNAPSGTIGGWTISSDRIIKGPSSADTCGLYSGAAHNWRIFCGDENIVNAPFRVDKFGNLYAESATITGALTATSGNVIAALAAGSITSSHIAANTIVAADIAAGTITATEIAANTITAAKIAAGTITATEIAANTITAAEIATMDLSAISANLGTITAGSISGVSITGSTISQASGALVIDSDGLTLSSGTADASKLKWSNGASIYQGSDVFRFEGAGGGAPSIYVGGNIEATSMTVNPGTMQASNAVIVNAPQVTAWIGGGTRFVCVDNNGNLFSQSSVCN